MLCRSFYRKLLFVTALYFGGILGLYAQNTIGLLLNTPDAYDGYTLFAPKNFTSTYLIDNCGYQVHAWESNYVPGEYSYLLPDGNLLRTCRIESDIFAGGGIGGRIEILDWESNIVWEFDYASDLYHHHHEALVLPNGNILTLAWEYKNNEEVLAAGRNPATFVASAGMWPVHIFEIQPIGTNEATIVWEWHVWDHLVQDFDATKSNYGAIAEHPERVDVNYRVLDEELGDWIHANALDYNAELDQIVLSSRHFDEIWIIDHSTTTVEAAGSTGGIWGKGGDLLYRWGNSQVYGRGTIEDKTFFGQHNVHWVADSLQNGGKLLLFNNGIGRPEGEYSTVEVLVPPTNLDGSYIIPETMPFGPASAEIIYADPNNLYSAIMSGVQRLANGNLLLCEGATGHFLEVNAANTIVWEYINPVSSAAGAIMPQGTLLPPNTNFVFRAYRFDANYSGLLGHELLPSVPVEITPQDYDCEIYTSVNNNQLSLDAKLYPNPFSNNITYTNTHFNQGLLRIYNVQQVLVHQQTILGNSVTIATQHWAAGLYIAQFPDGKTHKIIKQ